MLANVGFFADAVRAQRAQTDIAQPNLAAVGKRNADRIAVLAQVFISDSKRHAAIRQRTHQAFQRTPLEYLHAVPADSDIDRTLVLDALNQCGTLCFLRVFDGCFRRRRCFRCYGSFRCYRCFRRHGCFRRRRCFCRHGGFRRYGSFRRRRCFRCHGCFRRYGSFRRYRCFRCRRCFRCHGCFRRHGSFRRYRCFRCRRRFRCYGCFRLCRCFRCRRCFRCHGCFRCRRCFRCHGCFRCRRFALLDRLRVLNNRLRFFSLRRLDADRLADCNRIGSLRACLLVIAVSSVVRFLCSGILHLHRCFAGDYQHCRRQSHRSISFIHSEHSLLIDSSLIKSHCFQPFDAHVFFAVPCFPTCNLFM